MKRTKFLLVAFAFVLMLSACRSADYNAAEEKTQSMTDYTMNISTIITIEGNGGIKQSAIEQVVRVNNKGKKTMIYDVETKATSTDVATGEIVEEINSYMYSSDSYYYAYPGVRYKSAVDFDMALSNIESLTDVITFSEDEMIDVQREKEDGEEVLQYQVNYADTSPFVKGVLENAAATFDGLSFSPSEVGASAVIADNKVKGRELYIVYGAETGEKISVEIYTEYTEPEKLEKPDESKYVNIMG